MVKQKENCAGWSGTRLAGHSRGTAGGATASETAYSDIGYLKPWIISLPPHHLHQIQKWYSSNPKHKRHLMSAQSSPSLWIHIPDTLASWPWPRKINPHYKICKIESSTWIKSFGVQLDKSTHEAFSKCDPSRSAPCFIFPENRIKLTLTLPQGLLAALGYSSCCIEGCRIGCDLMGVFLVIDERTDKAADDVAQIKADVQVIMDAIRNPHHWQVLDECDG